MGVKESSAKQGGKSHGLADVRALARVLRQYDLSVIEVETEETRVLLKRDGARPSVGGTDAAHAVPAHLPAGSAAAASAVDMSPVAATVVAAKESAEDGLEVATSPFVGTFYRSPSPESPAYCEVGAVVRKGQTLCIVEAMKLMNEIEAELDGRVVEVLVKNGDSVEYGQPLFKIKPS